MKVSAFWKAEIYVFIRPKKKLKIPTSINRAKSNSIDNLKRTRADSSNSRLGTCSCQLSFYKICFNKIRYPMIWNNKACTGKKQNFVWTIMKSHIQNYKKKCKKKNSIAVERIIQKKKKNPAKIIPEMRTFALLQKQGICVSGREIETKMEAGPSFPDKVWLSTKKKKVNRTGIHNVLWFYKQTNRHKVVVDQIIVAIWCEVRGVLIFSRFFVIISNRMA